MPRLTRNVHRSVDAGLGRIAALALLMVLPIWNPAYAQNRPPLPGESVATEGTIQQFYRGMNFMVVKTIDGVEHVYNFTKDLIVHGGKNPRVEGLEGLREGTTVAVHFSTGGTKASADEIDVLGDEGLSIVEGVITDMRRYAIMRCRSWPDDRPPSRLTALWREESPNSEGQCAG